MRPMISTVKQGRIVEERDNEPLEVTVKENKLKP